MIVRRFEGKVRWREITLDGARVTHSLGALGKRGIGLTTIYPDETAARAEFDAKVRGYLAAGLAPLDEGVRVAQVKELGAPEIMRTATVAEEATRVREREASKVEAAERRAEWEAEAPARAAREAERARERAAFDVKHAESERARAEREAQRKALEAERAARVATEWPAPPRWFEEVWSGRTWAVLAHGTKVYQTRVLKEGPPIAVTPCASDDEARSEADRLEKEKIARDWIPHFPELVAPRVVPRRLPVLDAFAARAIVRRAIEEATDYMESRGFGWSSDADTKALVARLTSRAEGAPPFDAKLDARAFALLLFAKQGPAESGSPQRLAALVDVWVAQAGVARAFAALRETDHFEPMRIGDRVRVTTALAHDAFERMPAWHRLRRHVASATPEARAAALDAARASWRQSRPELRCSMALAFPQLRSMALALVDEQLALPETLPLHAVPLLASAASRDHARRFAKELDVGQLEACVPWVDDLVDVIGAEAMDALELFLERAARGATRRAIGRVIARILDPRAVAVLRNAVDDRDLLPGMIEGALASPDAFADRVVSAAAMGGATGAIAIALLTWMLRATDGHLAVHVRGPGARRAMRIASARASERAACEPARSEAIPEVLRAPPWRGPRTPPRPVHALPALPYEERVVWAPGIREEWLSAAKMPDELAPLSQSERDARCEEQFDRVRDTNARCDPAVLLAASPVVALAAWQDISPGRWKLPLDALRAFLARHELAALDGLVAFRVGRMRELPALMLPFDSPRLAEVAALTIDAPGAGPHARAWLAAHPEAATIGLLPLVVGPSDEDRELADCAIHEVARAGHAGVVLAVARRFGDEIAEIVRPLVERDPRIFAPAMPPMLPDAWESEALPAPVLSATGRALPKEALDALGELFVLDAQKPRPEIEAVRAACDPASLAELAFEATVRWIAAGEELVDAAMLRAVAYFGDDESARLVADVARRADDENRPAIAYAVIDALATLASPMAILHLLVLARFARLATVSARATSALERIARARGVDSGTLADESIPDFGLDSEGSLALDLGARFVRVGFDERLEPFVLDEAGVRSKHLPSLQDDDPEHAADAEALWRRLKRDVSAFGAVTSGRLEDSMRAKRQIPRATFEERYWRHPLVRHLAAAVVWQTSEGATFRITEDWSLAGVEDEPFDLGAARWVRVPDAATLGPELHARWRARFSDYEIVQPLAQL